MEGVFCTANSSSRGYFMDEMSYFDYFQISGIYIYLLFWHLNDKWTHVFQKFFFQKIISIVDKELHRIINFHKIWANDAPSINEKFKQTYNSRFYTVKCKQRRVYTVHSAQCTDVNTKSLLKKSFTIRAAFVENHQIHHVLQSQFISPVVECCFVGLLRCFLWLLMNYEHSSYNIHNAHKIVMRFGRDNLACHIILENGMLFNVTFVISFGFEIAAKQRAIGIPTK